MTDLTAYVDRLLRLGGDRHPASAIIGVRTAHSTGVAAGGWASLPGPGQPGDPMQHHTLLDVASVTKVAATTTVAMRLVAEGALGLDDPVQRYLPDFAGDGKEEITIEQLLSHTGGLQPWWPLYLEANDREAVLRVAQRLPLAAAPGTIWRYSDLGLILLGYVVERLTGGCLAEAYRRLVAEPIGLGARFGPVDPQTAATSADSDAYEFTMVDISDPYPVPFAADGFTGWRARPVRGVVNDGNAAHALGGIAGHAGLFSSVDDLLTLGAALRRGDFLPPDVLTRFATPSDLNAEQALGFRHRVLEVRGQAVTLLYHPGFTGTLFGFALETDLVVAGGAMRLHGTVGALPAAGSCTKLPDVVPGPDIHRVVIDAGLHALDPEEDR